MSLFNLYLDQIRKWKLSYLSAGWPLACHLTLPPLNKQCSGLIEPLLYLLTTARHIGGGMRLGQAHKRMDEDYFFFFSPNTISWLVHSAKNQRMADLASFHSLQPFTVQPSSRVRLLDSRGSFRSFYLLASCFITDQIIFQKEQITHSIWGYRYNNKENN